MKDLMSKGVGILHFLQRQAHMCEDCCKKYYEKSLNPTFARTLDKIILPVGLMGPFLGIPQVVKIFVEQDASSIELTSWLLFLIPAGLWTVYGVVHREKPIFVCNASWMRCSASRGN